MATNRLRTRDRWSAAVILLALALRVTAVLATHNVPYSDSVWYDATAWRLITHGEYGPTGPSAWFPPGYSFFLAGVYGAFGHSYVAAKLVQAVCGTLTCAVVYRLVAESGSVRQARFAALVVACWPNLIFHTLILDSETLSALQFAGLLWLASPRRAGTRKRWIAWGALLGWSVLTRPVAIIIVPTVAAWWWIDRRDAISTIRVLTMPLMIAAFIVGTWTLRNWRTFHEWIPISTNAGYNLWQANQAYADGGDTFWGQVPMSDPEYRTMRFGNEFVRNREGARYGRAYIASHRLHLIRLAPRKLFLLYHTDTSGLYEAVLNSPSRARSWLAEWITSHRNFVESATFRFYFVVLVVAGVAAILSLWGTASLPKVLPLLPLLLFAFHFPFHAKDRFHVPLDPAFAMLASFGFVGKPGKIARFVRVFGIGASFAAAAGVIRYAVMRCVGARSARKRVHNFTMLLDPRDPGISRELMIRGEREEQLRRVIEGIVRPGDAVIDLGANIGYYTLQLAALVGPTGRVYALEPAPENFERLRRNLQLNPSLQSRVETLRLAAAAQAGTERLFLSSHANQHSMLAVERAPKGGMLPNYVDVPVVSLSAFLGDCPPVQFIRMDVEGYEVSILRGLRQAIVDRRFRGTICFEVHTSRYAANPGAIREELEFLFAHGYRVAVVTSQREEDSALTRRGYRPFEVIRTHHNTTRGLYRDVAHADVVALVSEDGGLRDVVLEPAC